MAGAGGSNRARRWGLLFFFVFLVITLIIIIIIVIFFFFAFFSGGLTGFAANGKPYSRGQIIVAQLGELILLINHCEQVHFQVQVN